MQGKILVLAVAILSLMAPAVAETSSPVQISIPKTRGVYLDEGGVAKIKLVNPNHRVQECNVTSYWNDTQKKTITRDFVSGHDTFWFTDLNKPGEWTFSAYCLPDGGTSSAAVTIESIDEPVSKPRVDHQSWGCDEHGFLAFNVEYSNYLSTDTSKYYIWYRGVRQQAFKVHGSHGQWAGIDGVVKSGGDVEVIANKTHVWTYPQPKCNPTK